MRVIAGSARGRRLKAPAGWKVRPTSDRVKEAVFDIVGSRRSLSGAVVLDLFAGSGAVGIEALSRGASRVLFVEWSRTARRVLAENLCRCGLDERGDIWPLPARRALAQCAAQGCKFQFAFIDPPYGRGLADEALEQLGEADVMGEDAWVVAEYHVGDHLADAYGPLRLTGTHRYGRTSLALFRNERVTGERNTENGKGGIRGIL